MVNYELPLGFYKMDSVAGTVVRTSFKGFEVALDNGSSDIPGKARAFVHGRAEIGQRVIVLLTNFNKRHENFGAKLDGILDDTPSLETAMTALAA